MEDILINMNPVKREKFINSSLKEFSNNTFNKASTNNIVKNAGISKGLLFHYFSSKKKLYDYLFDFSIKTMIEPIMAEVGYKETDIIKRIKDIALIKLRVSKKYPDIINFINTMYDGKSLEEIKKLISERVPDVYRKIYHYNVDFGLFKDNVDPFKAINTIKWTVEKLSEEYMEKMKITKENLDMRAAISDLEEYLKMLKEVFYK